MLKKLYTLLSNKELLFLNTICSSFIETKSHSIISKDENNYYIRKMLNPKTDLLEYQKKCMTHLESQYEIDTLWINKINTITNIDDHFHVDLVDLSIVTYLNEDFEGGEFEYIFNDEKIKIKPIINSSLIMDKKTKHRVLSVTNGERFSLVSFYNKIQKKQKTLI
jgi:Rps23 Pro-64 3,4-dihydroxylase Tpa1-like proline 4-hydroxylase